MIRDLTYPSKATIRSMKVDGKSKLQYFIEDLIATTLSWVKVVLLSKWFVPRIKSKKNNSTCVVLGNGPSLNSSLKEHPDFFKDKDLMAVNFFWMSEYFQVLKPRYYVIVSMNYWTSTKTDINDTGRKQTFGALAEMVDWKMDLIIPAQAKNKKGWDKEIRKNPNITVKHLNITPIEGFGWFRNLMFSKNMGLPRPHNVLIPSIKLAIDLEYEKTYILGAEHSWLKELYVDDNNNVWLTQKHFYESQNKKPEVMYRGTSNEVRTMAEVLMKFVHSFESYWILKDYAQKQKVQVVNATKGSFIDAFDREYIKE